MSARRIRTRHGRFLPYRYERFGLDFELTGCSIDGHEQGVTIDTERRKLDIDQNEFRAATVRLRIDLPPETLERVVPASELERAELALLVTVRCRETRLRRAVKVAGGRLAAGSYAERLVLHRDEWSGVIELAPFLIRTSRAVAHLPGFADQPGSRLASARPWSLRAEPEPSARGKFLDVRYCVFADDEILAPHRDTLYRLDGDQDQPVLWINSGHAKVASVLDDRGTRGARARMRDVFFDQIAYGVWSQLFLRAASKLGDDANQAYSWERTVLREVLPEMYPGAATPSAQLAALRAALDDGDLGLVVEQLDRALQRKNENGAHMAKLAEEVFERGGA